MVPEEHVCGATVAFSGHFTSSCLFLHLFYLCFISVVVLHLFLFMVDLFRGLLQLLLFVHHLFGVVFGAVSALF